jgi:hypothetical protein
VAACPDFPYLTGAYHERGGGGSHMRGCFNTIYYDLFFSSPLYSQQLECFPFDSLQVRSFPN